MLRKVLQVQVCLPDGNLDAHKEMECFVTNYPKTQWFTPTNLTQFLSLWVRNSTSAQLGSLGLLTRVAHVIAVKMLAGASLEGLTRAGGPTSKLILHM